VGGKLFRMGLSTEQWLKRLPEDNNCEAEQQVKISTETDWLELTQDKPFEITVMNHRVL
jgi:hypothetical protein